MKIKVIPSVIALAMSALIAYGFYYFCKSDNQTLLSVGSGVMSFCMLLTAFGLSFQNPRASANIKVVSIVFFILALISNLIFAFVQFYSPAYIITNGLILLVWLLVAYAVGKAKQ